MGVLDPPYFAVRSTNEFLYLYQRSVVVNKGGHDAARRYDWRWRRWRRRPLRRRAGEYGESVGEDWVWVCGSLRTNSESFAVAQVPDVGEDHEYVSACCAYHVVKVTGYGSFVARCGKRVVGF